MNNAILKKLSNITTHIFRYFKNSENIENSALNKAIYNNRILSLKKNQDIESFYFFAKITEIKESGQLAINAGKDDGIFIGCTFDLLDFGGKCIVISVDKKNCIAEVCHKNIKEINIFTGEEVDILFLPKCKVGNGVRARIWRLL